MGRLPEGFGRYAPMDSGVPMSTWYSATAGYRHCIPVYPRLYLAGDPDTQLPVTARELNEAVLRRAVHLLAELTGGLPGLRVAMLGAAYRGGVKQTAFSGVFAIVHKLAMLGAVPLVHDPLYSDAELHGLDLEPYHFGEPCDAVITQTDHREYKMLSPGDLPGVRALIDGRAITDTSLWAGIPRRILGIGDHHSQQVDGKPRDY